MELNTKRHNKFQTKIFDGFSEIAIKLIEDKKDS